jgi:hypothetical protein
VISLIMAVVAWVYRHRGRIVAAALVSMAVPVEGACRLTPARAAASVFALPALLTGTSA